MWIASAAAMLADMPDGLGRQAEPLEKRLMRLRVPLFKRDMQLANGKMSFGVVQEAQAIGDFEVLNERGRRALRLHLDDLQGGLIALGKALDAALA